MKVITYVNFKAGMTFLQCKITYSSLFQNYLGIPMSQLLFRRYPFSFYSFLDLMTNRAESDKRWLVFLGSYSADILLVLLLWISFLI